MPAPKVSADGFFIPAPRMRPLKEYKKDHIRREEELAKGTSGVVYRGYVKGHKEVVAIKDITVTDAYLFEEWKREVDVMRFRSDTSFCELTC